MIHTEIVNGLELPPSYDGWMDGWMEFQSVQSSPVQYNVRGIVIITIILVQESEVHNPAKIIKKSKRLRKRSYRS